MLGERSDYRFNTPKTAHRPSVGETHLVPLVILTRSRYSRMGI